MDKYNKLKEKYDKLVDERDQLQSKLEKIQLEKENLIVENKRFTDEYNKLTLEMEEKEENLAVLNQTISEYSVTINKLKTVVDRLSQPTIADKAVDFTQENGVPILGGGLLLGGLGFLVRRWWKSSGSNLFSIIGVIKELVAKVEDIREKLDKVKDCFENDPDVPNEPPTENPIKHENYKEPPPPFYPKYERQDGPSLYPKKPYPTGYGPVPPEYPARKYTSHEVLHAVDEVAHRHRDEPLLANIGELVRQILSEPRR